MRLAGKTALVTGSASGLGAGLPRALRADGAAVLLADAVAAPAMAGGLEIDGGRAR